MLSFRATSVWLLQDAIKMVSNRYDELRLRGQGYRRVSDQTSELLNRNVSGIFLLSVLIG